MSVSPQGISVQALYRNYRDGILIVNRKYQRKLVWSTAEKQNLIDSILQDYPLPLFLLAQINAEQKSSLEIIDGMQRLNAIFGFIEHGFKWNEKCFDIEESARARQAAEQNLFEPYTSEVERLSAIECANILDYQLAVTIFPAERDERISDVFGRINSGGQQLSDQERRQAGVLSPFATLVRTAAAEIRGDVSKDTLLLSEMPEISIDTSRNVHGYNLRAENTFWCHQGILRTGDLRASDDEEVIADIAASILSGVPVARSSDFLNKAYDLKSDEFLRLNRELTNYGSPSLYNQIIQIFSEIRATFEFGEEDHFSFRKTVYSRPTNNSQKSAFFAVFMAFYNLIIKEGMNPSDRNSIKSSLRGLSDRIKIGQKHIDSEERSNNIKVAEGLIRPAFSKVDVQAFTHGPGLIFDFENSLRRSRTESSRYEFKQGILRLDQTREKDDAFIRSLPETICAIANVGPDADGFLYIGIADKDRDAARIADLDGFTPTKIEEFSIVGVEREALILSLSIDKYQRIISDAIENSTLNDPLMTQVITSIDLIKYRNLSVVRIRVPKQKRVSFLGDQCYLRSGASTRQATAPEVYA